MSGVCPAALAPGLVQQDRGRGRDVEAVGDARHRQPDRFDVLATPGGGEAVRLAAQDDRDRPGQVRVDVQRWASTRVATIRSPLVRSHAATSSAGAATTGIEKTVPTLARITFGLNRSVPPTAITAVAPDAVGGAEDRAHVAGLLDVLGDDDERLRRQLEVRQGPIAGAHHEDDPVRSIAVGELLERPLALTGRSSPAAPAPGQLLGDALRLRSWRSGSGRRTRSRRSAPASIARSASRPPSTRSRARRARDSTAAGPRIGRCRAERVIALQRAC